MEYPLKVTSHSETDTANLAAELAETLLTPGTVIALSGDLGAGKSAFARAFIRHRCGANTDVPSPTFTLLQRYDPPNNTPPLFHFDLYRLEAAEEIWEIGWEDAIRDGIALIEWPGIISDYLPEDTLHVHLEITGPDESRSIRITQGYHPA